MVCSDVNNAIGEKSKGFCHRPLLDGAIASPHSGMLSVGMKIVFYVDIKGFNAWQVNWHNCWICIFWIMVTELESLLCAACREKEKLGKMKRGSTRHDSPVPMPVDFVVFSYFKGGCRHNIGISRRRQFWLYQGTDRKWNYISKWSVRRENRERREG